MPALPSVPVLAKVNPVPRVQAGLRWLGTAEGRHHRRVAVHPDGGRAHIELRGAHRPDGHRIAAAAKEAVEDIDGVEWAEVDGIVGRIIVVFDPESISAEDLVETIETVEEAHDALDERFPHDRPDHPADREPIQRHLIAIGADVAALGLATTLQVVNGIGIPTEIPGAIAFVDTQPRVRRLLESKIGRPGTDVTVAVSSAVAQGLGQGPLGLVVDIAHRVGVVREHQARKAVWDDREPGLVEGRHKVGHEAVELPGRPVPLPKGPIESYSDRAALGALGAAGVALGVTRNPRRSADLLLAGIPKAATLGREAFAGRLDTTLAAHGVIAMDHLALRRLDRVDTLVLEADVVRSDSWEIDEIEAVHEGGDPVQHTLRARALFVATEPLAPRRLRSWSLAPLAKDDVRVPRGVTTHSRRLGRGGRKVLGLWRGDTLEALVSVFQSPTPLAVDLVERANELDLDVVLMGANDALTSKLGVTQRIAAVRAVAEIGALQEAGHVVMFAGSRQHQALRVADIGLGVEREGERVPWGAHLVAGPGLDNVWRIVDSIDAARLVSKRSAMLALAGASTGGAWAFVGPGRSAASRAMLPINAAAIASVGLGNLAGLQAARHPVPNPDTSLPWHEMDGDEVLDQLDASVAGLTADEQARRRAATTSRVSKAPVSLGRAAVDELVNPLTPILALGAAMSAAVGSATDAALVGGVVGVNALVGAVQRVQTERSLLDLEEDGSIHVTVRVEGEVRQVPADTLVVGDVIELEAGESVPADCRILDAVALEVDESGITGESMPVQKQIAATPGAPVQERTSMLFEGTSIAAGTVVALVVAVGTDTEAGRSTAAAAAPPPSGVEERLGHLTRLTLPVSVVGGAAVAGLGFLYRRPPRASVGAGVSLMVAAVPEGLPALATLAQVASARRLAASNALVRNPRAIEAIGRVDQVCFDKTGTLTQNSISLVLVSCGGRDEPIDALGDESRALLGAALRATPLAADDEVLPHATDQAVIVGAATAGIDTGHGSNGWERRQEIPFESRRGYHAVLGDTSDEGALVSVKGAPEVVIPLCTSWHNGTEVEPIGPAALHQLEVEVERLGRQGLRVLAVAEAPASEVGELDAESGPGDLHLLGFVAFADLVRPTAAAALRDLHSAGVHVAMITGDHASTAEAIAAELGMLNGGRVLTGADLNQLSPDDLDAVIGEVAVFARVTPIQKVRIVESYQRIGRSVAMTGDGANDAAAIRLADAGIALGSRGTAAARQVADIVIVDDRIETIVEAVIEGRAMWESVRAAVSILVGGNLGEVGFTVLGTALSGTAPLNARQLLLVNLLTDMAPALAIALREPPDRDPERLLHEGPDASLGDALIREIAIRAGATAAGATMAWGTARFTGTPTRARTVALAGLVGAQLGQTLVAGGNSPLVLGATAVSIGALVTAIQTPGVSQFFGCRPLGPVGWSTAIAASVAATAGSVAVPWAFESAGRQIRGHLDHADTPELPGPPELTLVPAS
jgi:cation-transporting ATPase I